MMLGLRPTLLRSFRRSISDFSTSEIESARKWLQTFHHPQIPKDCFEISFSRSSGPGGQKVNKTSSKATVSMEPYQWLNPRFCSWIPKPILHQVTNNKVRYQTKSGGILIQSDSSRDRETNTEECFRKLLQEIKDNVYFEAEVSEEDKKKWAGLAADHKEKKMFHKKRQSDKKKSRSKNFDI